MLDPNWTLDIFSGHYDGSSDSPPFATETSRAAKLARKCAMIAGVYTCVWGVMMILSAAKGTCSMMRAMAASSGGERGASTAPPLTHCRPPTPIRRAPRPPTLPPSCRSPNQLRLSPPPQVHGASCIALGAIEGALWLVVWCWPWPLGSRFHHLVRHPTHHPNHAPDHAPNFAPGHALFPGKSTLFVVALPFITLDVLAYVYSAPKIVRVNSEKTLYFHGAAQGLDGMDAPGTTMKRINSHCELRMRAPMGKQSAHDESEAEYLK
mmetsp:Transcript_76992/g.221124  ORF Transcript_76992/g.221124 Transcript_76992/m.221124 type:complete len:265 (-) Transcript_76992:607-1401(-)